LHTFPRRTELMLTPWTEIGENDWTLPGARMKMDRPHVIPLSDQVKAMFARLKELAGDSPWVFPSPKNHRKPRNVMGLSQALHRLGYKGIFSPHGVRATAASILADRGYSREVIDTALAHSKGDDTAAAYHRSQYLDRRREMMQEWSRLLDGIAKGANVVPIRAAA